MPCKERDGVPYQLRNRCMYTLAAKWVRPYFFLPQEIITKTITGTDLGRKDFSVNGNQLNEEKQCEILHSLSVPWLLEAIVVRFS